MLPCSRVSLLPSSIWEQAKPFLGNIPLPIGISFYTFQGISLVMDLYRAGAKGVPGAEIAEGRQASSGFISERGFSNHSSRSSFPGQLSKHTSSFIRSDARPSRRWIGMAH
jgi:hypothetical protein